MRVCAALVLLFPAAARADALDELMGRLSKMPGLEARFVEDKHITLLQAPLSSEGTLRFLPPSTLSRETTKPQRSVLLIAGDRLYFDEGKGRQEVNVGGSPVVRTFVQSFVLLLAGDRIALEKVFAMTYSGGERWKLELVPKDPAIGKIIRRMLVEGRGVALESLVVEEASGDRSVTRFSDVNPERRFSDEDRARLFDRR
jgi:outer membrane lipoprotein-sorting protein